MRLRVFGLTFGIDTANGKLSLLNPPADLEFELEGFVFEHNGNWSAEFRKFRGSFAGVGFVVAIPELLLHASGSQPDLLIPNDKPVPDQSRSVFKVFQDREPSGGWCVVLSGYRLVSSGPPNTAFATLDGRLVARFHEDTVVLGTGNPGDLPFDLAPGNGGFILDLNRGRVLPTRDALRIRVGVEALNDPPPNRPRPLWVWRGRSSTAPVIDLRNLQGATDLRFFPEDSRKSLLLGADTRAPEPSSSRNPVIGPLEVIGCRLDLRLRYRRNRDVVLDGIAMAPAGESPMILTAHAWTDARNKASRWRIAEALGLTMRARTRRRPGALSLAGDLDVPVQPADPADMRLNGLHGIIGRSRFRAGGDARLCSREIDERPNPVKNVNAGLMADTVLPWVRFSGSAAGQEVLTARPGETFAGDDARTAANFEMSGDRLALPLIDRRHVSMDRVVNWDREVEDMERVVRESQSRRHDKPARHDTALSEPVLRELPLQRFRELFTAARRPAPEGGQGIGTPVPSEGSLRPAPRIGDYRSLYDFGEIGVKVIVEPEQLDYILVGHDLDLAVFDAAEITGFSLDPTGNFKLTGGVPRGQQSIPRAIVKLTRKDTLEEIFQREGLGRTYVIPGGTGNSRDLFRQLLPSEVNERTWTGLVMFGVPVAGQSGRQDQQGLAGELIGNSLDKSLELAYLAVSPRRNRQGRIRGSHFARVIWENGEPALEPSPFGAPRQHDDQDRDESRFQLKKIDVSWDDGDLGNLYIETRFLVDSFFGLRRKFFEDPRPNVIAITGRFDDDENRVRFIADLSEPWQLFPFGEVRDPVGPIRKVTLSSVEISRSLTHRTDGGRLSIVIDGSIELRGFSIPGLPAFDGFEVGENSRLDFAGLDLELPDFSKKLNLRGYRLRFGYPAMRFGLDLSPFNIGPIQLKMKSIAISWNGHGIDWQAPLKIIPDVDFDPELPTFFLDLRIDFGPLPELALKSVDRLLLDLQIGIQGRGGRYWDRIQIGLSGVEFQKFELDLMRFLTISAGEVSLESLDVDPPGPRPAFRYSRFLATDVKIRILDKTVVENLTLALVMPPGGETGILSYIPTNTGGFLDIRWVMIGRNIVLQSRSGEPQYDLPTRIMSADLLGEDSEIAEQISERIKDGAILPIAVTDRKIGDWLFAAGFSLSDLLDGRFLFQDRRYYGVAIGGGIFRDWFGFDFALSVLYEKGPTPSQDRMVISIRAPRVVLPAFSFLGGVISLEIGFNNSFLLDVGFPWRVGSSRLWNRAFGAIVTPFQASGGFYLRKDIVVPDVGKNLMAVGGGYALQGGLGASFGGGVFTVQVTVGFYTVIDGVAVLAGDDIRAFRFTGAVGVLLRGAGEINFWIISVRVEIVVGAEASLTLAYKQDPTINLPQIGLPAGVGSNNPVIRVDFLLYARASARACIGKGWFKICKSISVNVPMRISYDLKL